MKLENQVVSLDLAKRLKELGVKQESLFYWRVEIDEGQEYPEVWYEKPNERRGLHIYSAFTVAELGELLPQTIQVMPGEKTGWNLRWLTIGRFLEDMWCVGYESTDGETVFHEEQADNEANARAKMFVYLLENKLI